MRSGQGECRSISCNAAYAPYFICYFFHIGLDIQLHADEQVPVILDKGISGYIKKHQQRVAGIYMEKPSAWVHILLCVHIKTDSGYILLHTSNSIH